MTTKSPKHHHDNVPLLSEDVEEGDVVCLDEHYPQPDDNVYLRSRKKKVRSKLLLYAVVLVIMAIVFSTIYFAIPILRGFMQPVGDPGLGAEGQEGGDQEGPELAAALDGELIKSCSRCAFEDDEPHDVSTIYDLLIGNSELFQKCFDKCQDIVEAETSRLEAERDGEFNDEDGEFSDEDSDEDDEFSEDSDEDSEESSEEDSDEDNGFSDEDNSDSSEEDNYESTYDSTYDSTYNSTYDSTYDSSYDPSYDSDYESGEENDDGDYDPFNEFELEDNDDNYEYNHGFNASEWLGDEDGDWLDGGHEMEDENDDVGGFDSQDDILINSTEVPDTEDTGNGEDSMGLGNLGEDNVNSGNITDDIVISRNITEDVPNTGDSTGNDNGTNYANVSAIANATEMEHAQGESLNEQEGNDTLDGTYQLHIKPKKTGTGNESSKLMDGLVDYIKQYREENATLKDTQTAGGDAGENATQDETQRVWDAGENAGVNATLDETQTIEGDAGQNATLDETQTAEEGVVDGVDVNANYNVNVKHNPLLSALKLTNSSALAAEANATAESEGDKNEDFEDNEDDNEEDEDDNEKVSEEDSEMDSEEGNHEDDGGDFEDLYDDDEDSDEDNDEDEDFEETYNEDDDDEFTDTTPPSSTAPSSTEPDYDYYYGRREDFDKPTPSEERKRIEDTWQGLDGDDLEDEDFQKWLKESGIGIETGNTETEDDESRD